MPLKGKQVPLRVAEIPTLLKVQVPLRRLSSSVAPSVEGAVMKYPSIAELIPTSRSWQKAW